MTEIVWQDPPPSKRGGDRDSSREQFIASLRERPGQWAVYPCASSGANGPTRTRFRREGLDAVSRKVDGEIKLFVRVPA